jgi:hypothetical protein
MNMMVPIVAMPQNDKGKSESDMTAQKSVILSLDDATLSLFERATVAVMAELTGGDRSAELGYLGQKEGRGARLAVRRLPERWDQIHVLDRLEEAMATLRKLPMVTRPKSVGSAWPGYTYDRFDLNAQLETHELEVTQRTQNRVRPTASPAEIARMEQVLEWVVRFLRRYPEVAQAVQLAAVWAALRLDEEEIEYRLERRADQSAVVRTPQKARPQHHHARAAQAEGASELRRRRISIRMACRR